MIGVPAGALSLPGKSLSYYLVMLKPKGTPLGSSRQLPFEELRLGQQLGRGAPLFSFPCMHQRMHRSVVRQLPTLIVKWGSSMYCCLCVNRPLPCLQDLTGASTGASTAARGSPSRWAAGSLAAPMSLQPAGHHPYLLLMQA